MEFGKKLRIHILLPAEQQKSQKVSVTHNSVVKKKKREKNPVGVIVATAIESKGAMLTIRTATGSL